MKCSVRFPIRRQQGKVKSRLQCKPIVQPSAYSQPKRNRGIMMYIRFRKLTVDGCCIHIHQPFIRLHGILKCIRINRIARSGSKATASEAKTPFSVRFFTPFYIRLTCIGNKTACFRSFFGNRFRFAILFGGYAWLRRYSFGIIWNFGRYRICFRFMS